MRNFTALAVLSFMVLGGCTRGTSKTSSVSLSLSSSSFGSLDAELGMVIVNVSGGNIRSPILFQWDRYSCASAACAPPSQFVIPNVPTGNDVLIQVLTVYKNESTEAMTFKYGDAAKNLSSGDVVVEVTPVTIGGSTMEARVYGRYLDQTVAGVATGATGILETKFKPPASASVRTNPPALTVERNFVFAGWMSLMALDGDAKFDYFLNGARILSDVNIQSMQNLAASNDRFLEVYVPTYYREEDGGPGGAIGLRSEAAQRIFLGYFGPAASGEKACYSNGTGINIPGAFVAGTSGAYPIMWNGQGNTSTANSAAPARGGVAFTEGSEDSCTDKALAFSQNLVFNYLGLRNGHDSVAGFRGPFRAMGAHEFINAFSSGTGLTLEIGLLPGVASSTGINALRVLRRASSGNGGDDIYGMGDGIQCSKLESIGFTRVGPDVSVSAGTSFVEASFPTYNAMMGNDLVVCPVMAGGLMANAGIEIHQIQTPPEFRILGRDFDYSRTDAPALTAGIQLLKDAVKNGGYRFALHQQGQFVQDADIDSTEVQINGGPWESVDFFGEIYDFNGSQTVGFITVEDSDPFHTILSSNNDTVSVRLKFKLNTPGSPEFTSPPFVLVGANDCSAPGSLVAYNMDLNDGSSTYALSDLLNVGNTDNRRRFQMRWSGCTGANWAGAPLDFFTIDGGTMTPSGCFGMDDISRIDALTLAIDPRDRAQADCSLSGVGMTFNAPSPTTDTMTVTASSVTIAHSTVPDKMAMAPSATALTAIGDLRYFYDLVLLGASAPFAANAVYLNSDGNVVTNTSAAIPSSSTSWFPGPLPGWLSSAPAPGAFLSVMTASAAAGGPIRVFAASNASKTGGFAYSVSPAGSNVLAASEHGLNQGSSVMLIDNGTKVQIGFVPGEYGNFIGQNLILLDLPITNITAPTNAKIHLINTFSGTDVFVAMNKSNISYFFYGRIEGYGSQITINWATPTQVNPSSALYDAQVRWVSVVPHMLIAYSGAAGANTISFGPFPSFVYSAWDGPAMPSGTAHINSNAPSTWRSLVGFAQCEGDVYVLGGMDGSGYLSYRRFDTGTSTLSVVLATTTVLASNYTQGACISFGSSMGARFIVAYNPAATVSNAVAFQGASAVCGGSPNSQLTLSGSLPTLSSGGFRQVFAGPNGANFVYESSGRTVVKAVPIACATSGSAQIQLGSSTVTAELNASPTSINGAAAFQGNGPWGLILFGNNSQYYQLRSR